MHLSHTPQTNTINRFVIDPTRAGKGSLKIAIRGENFIRLDDSRARALTCLDPNNRSLPINVLKRSNGHVAVEFEPILSGDDSFGSILLILSRLSRSAHHLRPIQSYTHTGHAHSSLGSVERALVAIRWRGRRTYVFDLDLSRRILTCARTCCFQKRSNRFERAPSSKNEHDRCLQKPYWILFIRDYRNPTRTSLSRHLRSTRRRSNRHSLCELNA